MTASEFFAARTDALRQGVLAALGAQSPQTATQLRVQLRAGMRELDRVLQQLRREGVIVSRRRWWELVA